MSSNAWSARRSTHRRPPVCKSKPKKEEKAAWPTTVMLTLSWDVTVDPLLFSQFNQTFAATHVGSGIYSSFRTDVQGRAVTVTFSAPLNGTAFIVISIAGYNGEPDFTGLGNSWPGTLPWLFTLEPSPLTPDPSINGLATWDASFT